VRFGECDPAGILYYPRYFDLFHRAMEAWFGQALGLPYARFIQERKQGIPSVHAQADYHAPSAFGDVLDVLLSVERVGHTSLAFAYRVVGQDGLLRATGQVVCVLMDLDPDSDSFRRAIPLDGDLRERVQAWRTGPA